MGYTKQQRAEKALMSTGIGESKVFRDPNAPEEDNPLLDCHINGQKIRDLGFTPLQLSAMSWHITDEGIAANNEGKQEVRASVTRDPLQKSMDKRRDDVLERGMETWEAEDAMRDQVKEHVRPGFKARYLSDATVQKRGMRGWKPVIEDGQPVKLGNMTLAEMPIEKAEARNRKFREDSNARLADVKRQYLESGRDPETGSQTAVAD
jgi:hypothetical protein